MSLCVLCGVDIVKKTDKNLVDGRRGNSIKVREEMLSLECKVEINPTYICRNCLCALTKRRALLNNLHEVNSSIQKIPIRNKIHERESALKQNKQSQKDILPFDTQYQPSVPNIKEALMNKWHLIQNQPLLQQIFKEPPIISFIKGKSLKDTLVRAKI